MTEPVVGVIPEYPDNPHRLGRNLNHDPRSRAFAFRAAPDTPLPSVHWDRAVPIFDQGDLGSCTGNAAAGWLATANALRPGLEQAALIKGIKEPVDEAAAVWLYENATAIDPYDGHYPPDDTGSDGLSVTKVLRARMVSRARKRHMTEEQWVVNLVEVETS